jgi:hypothetical protein
MTCRHCGAEIAGNALICYRCGTATAAPRVQPPAATPIFGRRRRGRPVTVGLVVCVVVAIVLWLVFS